MSEPSDASRRDPRPLVLIPTYNERENLADIVAATLSVGPELRVLVIDDASPDGTGALADELAAAEPRVQVLHRPGKQGLGARTWTGFGSGWRRRPSTPISSAWTRIFPTIRATCAG